MQPNTVPNTVLSPHIGCMLASLSYESLSGVNMDVNVNVNRNNRPTNLIQHIKYT